MARALTSRQRKRLAAILGVACFVTVTLNAAPACAHHLLLHTYDAEQGLTSLGGACLVQDSAGYILVCSEHGVFVYDGTRFFNLGLDQGLRSGGLVYDIARTSSGRVAVGFADEVLVSDSPADSTHSPASLKFQSVLHPRFSFYNQQPHRLAAWHSNFVFIAGGDTEVIVLPSGGQPRMERISYSAAEQDLLKNPRAVFSAGEHLWETFADDRLCIADPGKVQCFTQKEGLRGGPWLDVVDGVGTTVMARSATKVASFDAKSGGWSIVELPDQSGRYVNYRAHLGLFAMPNGEMLTQSEHGLAILKEGQWHVLTSADGAPDGTITSAMTDSSNQVWFQVLGHGLVKWASYGHWETLEKIDGLSEDLAWRTARAPGGALWVSTDAGVDEVIRKGGALYVSKTLPGPSFAIATGRRGELWRGYGISGVRVVEPTTGLISEISSPAVDAIMQGTGDVVWLGTENGLFKVVDRQGQPLVALPAGSPPGQVVDIALDASGGVFYLSGGRLRHLHVDGRDVKVEGNWPTPGFDPLALAIAPNGRIWIGGAGGLYSFDIVEDRVVSYTTVQTTDTRTNSVVAVMVDHRGWVWVGTAMGVSVCNKHRWVSVDLDTGLLADDVNQGGIREDTDGTVWITTAKGVSHLIDPEWLFADRPIQIVVSGAKLGTRDVEGSTLPYTTDSLNLQFGSPSHGALRSFKFRYRLSGVDANWAETHNGLVRYPSVPPGSHTLTVIGYDELTHTESQAAKLKIVVAFPWWRQWWSETLSILALIGVTMGGMRLRFRAILAQQARLKRYVDETTEQLRYEVAHDSLTGLLNRSEVERRLNVKLINAETPVNTLVALLDLDNFKSINDFYGHLGGDDVLRGIGKLIRGTVAQGEYAGRYGGEEILLVLDDTDGRGAERVLGVHHAVRGQSFSVAGREIRVTCSIGVTWGVYGDDWESIIGRADKALYRAKGTGRDRVVELAAENLVERGGYGLGHSGNSQ